MAGSTLEKVLVPLAVPLSFLLYRPGTCRDSSCLPGDRGGANDSVRVEVKEGLLSAQRAISHAACCEGKAFLNPSSPSVILHSEGKTSPCS